MYGEICEILLQVLIALPQMEIWIRTRRDIP
jgi:hypothetical protein